ncbi:MAG: NAD(P)H-hydrate dehydratase [Hydrogenophaga sp.]|uniref:NAD(P)H-hydrate dehydratase n=1 Tax=Hydrogenophaga sp. TaxID=1904254 RepID=UPI003D9B9CCE
MRCIDHPFDEALYGALATRTIERAASAQLPAHTLMARAGLSVAQLAQALAPHARCIWVACGPGNNGGDGLVAATHLLHRARTAGRGLDVVVTLCADPARLPPDATHALTQAQAAGVRVASAPPDTCDLVIDALLGIGQLRTPTGPMAEQLARLQSSTAPVLCVDLPSGLDADSGQHLLGTRQQTLPGPRHTLALLTLKPGLFTADGRDQAGTVWFDDLGVCAPPDVPASAVLYGSTQATGRPHAAHKGSQGEVVVIGGQHISVNGAGMTGAAVLAARAALHAGAGRVYLCTLGAEDAAGSPAWDPVSPELMFRQWPALRGSTVLEHAAVVCGCGGGQAIAAVLTDTLQRARHLVLDADALNSIAADPVLQDALRQRCVRGQTTALTPHPLEAARLLGTSTTTVMSDRINAARTLSERFGCVCVLKGSGTVVCAPGETPRINASGNAALATAGTGDVLAGLIGAALAGPDAGSSVLLRVASAVHHHGWLADRWVARATSGDSGTTLTADTLARGPGCAP